MTAAILSLVGCCESFFHADPFVVRGFCRLPVDKGGRIADDGHFIPVPVVIGFDVECGCHYHVCIMFLRRHIDCIAADVDQVAIHLLFGLVLW